MYLHIVIELLYITFTLFHCFILGDLKQIRGFQANCILQLHPPAAITCCALQADWGLVTAGTAHGLALLDYVKNKPIMVKCTLNPNGKVLKWRI